MNIEIKRDLASRWFQTLQNAFCEDIVRIEKKSPNLFLKVGKEVIKKMKVEVNIEYCKMEKCLKKLG